MGSKIDLTGQRFGRLVAIKAVGKDKGKHILWECRCDCGKTTNVSTTKLTLGRTKSCGCWREERTKTHGKRDTRLYSIWAHMKQRCSNPNVERYPRYGGRGIKVCQEWADDFETFYIWAMANGYQDGLQIDRIDNDGDYKPENCRWVTVKDQCENKSTNIYIEYGGERHTLQEWVQITGIPLSTAYSRYKAGKPPEEILKK